MTDLIMLERFARIASNLRFAIFGVPKRDSRNFQKGGSVRESVNRFARIGPSKCLFAGRESLKSLGNNRILPVLPQFWPSPRSLKSLKFLESCT